MKIRQVSVTGLFGLFDHTIPLHSDQHITIIHGPNGVGKTIILRMLYNLLIGRYSIFRKVPFASFTVEFDDDTLIRVHTEDPGERGQLELIPNRSNRRVVIACTFHGVSCDPFIPAHPAHFRGIRKAHIIDRIDHFIPALTRVGPELWRNDATNEVMTLNDVFEHYGDSLHLSSDDYPKEPEQLKSLRDDLPIKFIQTQRLDVPDFNSPTEHGLNRLPTVSKYSDDLVRHIRSVLEQYAAVSQKLDREFPLRLFHQTDITDLGVDVLRNKLDALEKKRARLQLLGFLDLEQVINVIPDKIIADKSDVFSIYVQDVEDKLNVFNDAAQRVDLLINIINERFMYKRLSINREKGFLFTSDTGNLLRPTDLSSGEQHELILTFDLIFNLQPNSIVLIDEPEISLHIAWQEQYLSDLKRIVDLSGFNVVIATHSPEIIGEHWDLTVELKGPPNSSRQ